MAITNQTIGNIDNICVATQKSKLGTVLDALVTAIGAKTAYAGDSLTDEQVYLVNNTCVAFQNVQLGTLVNKMIEAQKTSAGGLTAIADFNVDQLNNSYVIAQKVVNGDVIGLGNLINDCITKINSGSTPLETGNSFLTFAITGQTGQSTIGDGTIGITMPSGTDVTALVPTFTVSPKATVKVGNVEQISGTTANDFTSPVTYTVTSESNVSKNWIVTVTLA